MVYITYIHTANLQSNVITVSIVINRWLRPYQIFVGETLPLWRVNNLLIARLNCFNDDCGSGSIGEHGINYQKCEVIEAFNSLYGTI